MPQLSVDVCGWDGRRPKVLTLRADGCEYYERDLSAERFDTRPKRWAERTPDAARERLRVRRDALLADGWRIGVPDGLIGLPTPPRSIAAELVSAFRAEYTDDTQDVDGVLGGLPLLEADEQWPTDRSPRVYIGEVRTPGNPQPLQLFRGLARRIEPGERATRSAPAGLPVRAQRRFRWQQALDFRWDFGAWVDLPPRLLLEAELRGTKHGGWAPAASTRVRCSVCGQAMRFTMQIATDDVVRIFECPDGHEVQTAS